MNEDQKIAASLRRLYADREPAPAMRPTFSATLNAAARRAEAAGQPRARWSLLAGSAVAAAALLAILLALPAREPTLDEDLRLAQSLSYDAVWRSPSDRLLAQSPSALLRGTPEMPRAGMPDFNQPEFMDDKEYL